MGQELCFVGRYVNIHWTIALATLARKTKIERILDVLIMPAILEDLAARHLERQPGTTARAVHFLARGVEAWAHDTAVHCAALPNAEAPLRGLRQAPVILGKLENG
jgi:hypothetical protein